MPYSIFNLQSSIFPLPSSLHRHRRVVQIGFRQHIEVCRFDCHVNGISASTEGCRLICEQFAEHHGVGGLAVFANQVALRVIDVIDAGQDERCDTIGHEVSDKWLEVSGQLLAFRRPELERFGDFSSAWGVGDALDGIAAIGGCQIDYDVSLLRTGCLAGVSLQAQRLQLDGAQGSVVIMNPHPDAQGCIEVVEQQEDKVTLSAGTSLVGKVAFAQTGDGLFVGALLGSYHHTQVAGHDCRHVVEGHYRPFAVVGIGIAAVGDAH